MADHWFADLSDEEDAVKGAPWQPFLQIAGGCFPLPIWFATEQECQDFIGTIPQGSPVVFNVSRRANPKVTADGADTVDGYRQGNEGES